MSERAHPPFEFGDAEFVSTYDELPLWSAPFGLALLEGVTMRTGIDVLDIGCGTGFPLIEIAQRFGASCQVHGIDPWTSALERVRTKLRQYDVGNVELHEGVAEHLPFPDGAFDLIVSNNGLNNVSDQARAVSECFRVSRPGAQMVLTMNLPESMEEFYAVFADILSETGRRSDIAKMREHIASKRLPLAATEVLLHESGFLVSNVAEDRFTMRFSNGTALFQHYFMRLAFFNSWEEVLEGRDVQEFFHSLEHRLNDIAARQGELTLTVPFACFDCMKP